MIEKVKALKPWAKLVGGLLFCGALVFAGYSIAQPTISDLAERNRAIAAADSLKSVKIDELRTSYQRAVFDFTSTNELIREAYSDSMTALERALLDEIAERDRDIETLASANAGLRDSLNSDLGDVVVTDSTVTATVNARKDYEDGFISADGKVSVDTRASPPTGRAELDFGVGMSPVVAISRDTTGLAQCDITFGDMPVVVDRLMCLNNLDPELPARQSFWDFAPEFTVGTLGIIGGVIVLIAAF